MQDVHGGRTAMRGVSLWSLFASLVIAAALVYLTLTFGNTRVKRIAEGNSFEINMTDYDYFPGEMVWRAGETITIRLYNDSQANPGKPHEFMVGQNPAKDETIFGERQEDGFEIPFFVGTDLIISEAKGVSMFMFRGFEISGDNLDELLVPMAMDMGGMDMGADAAMEQDMGAETEGDMQMGESMPEAVAEESMRMFVSQDLAAEMTMPDILVEMANNFMVVLEPGGSFTFSFTVPDTPGIWEYGCFQQTGEHYLNGMKGKIEVIGSGSAETSSLAGDA